MDKIKLIRIVYNYNTGATLCNIWNKMTHGNYTFTKNGKSIKIVGEELSLENADFIVVVNGGCEPDSRFFSKTIFLKMEPVFVDYRWVNVANWMLYDIIGSHNIPNCKPSVNALEWHLNKTREELLTMNIIKTKESKVSAVVSGKNFDIGHRLRLEFLLIAQNFIDLDSYGNFGSQKYEWNNFLGSPQFKDDALFQYKYSFACENNFIPNYVTEKLIDCILAETLCFYDGAPNIESIINPNAFIKIDLTSPVVALHTIIQAIRNNEYEKRILSIRSEKHRIINSCSIIPVIWANVWR